MEGGPKCLNFGIIGRKINCGLKGKIETDMCRHLLRDIYNTIIQCKLTIKDVIALHWCLLSPNYGRRTTQLRGRFVAMILSMPLYLKRSPFIKMHRYITHVAANPRS